MASTTTTLEADTELSTDDHTHNDHRDHHETTDHEGHFDLDAFERDLTAAVQGDVWFDPTIRAIFATDASHYQITPQCVVAPKDEADTVAAIKIAYQYRVPVTPRGGGTSLSGQTFGPGMVIDCSKYMTEILEVNEEEQWARVQPGVVRDQLNAQLKSAGLHFTPDPATGNRATVGGMVGNNTCGTRSVVYGKTIDNTFSVRVALYDGTVCDFEPVDDEEWQRRARGEGVSDTEAKLYRGVRDLINKYQDQIRERYPKVLRRVSGYNLDEFVDGAGYTGDIGPRREHNQGHRTWNMANLIIGSEGTLAYLLEAKLRLIPNPKATAICVVHFEQLHDALSLVDTMLEHKPTTVELLDDIVMDEARINAATKDLAWFIEGEPAAIQIVEFFGETQEEAHGKAEAFANDMRNRGVGQHHPVLSDPAKQADVWNTRKLGLGLITNVKGKVKGRDFIEDACVPTENLAEYIENIMDYCASMGINRVSKYAHASVGVVHIAPALDLHEPADVRRMLQIAERAFEWCMQFGGSWSGEHGDGQLRGQFLPKMFGDELYQAFRELKGIFDPHNLMNPGKVVDAPLMVENLRYQQPGYNQRIAEVKSNFHYRDQGGFALAVEQCNGVGACRKVGSGTMCPSYMATRDEKDVVRGRANALRMAMSGQIDLKSEDGGLEGPGVKEVLDLCLSCKACKTECPNAVDMAKLKADVTQMRYDKYGAPLGARVIADLPYTARLNSGLLAPIVNFMQTLSPVKWAMEKLVGIDRRRPMPKFATKKFTTMVNNREFKKGTLGQVVLFNDTYINHMEPHVGMSAIELLESCGYEVIVANAGCCQRPAMSKGLLHDAKERGWATMQRLDKFAKQGLPILCVEPSCASALSDDLPDLIDDVALGKRVSQAIKMVDVFLAEEVKAGRLNAKFTVDKKRALIHGHCHQKALFGTSAMKSILDEVDGLQYSEVDSGCCGMAGSFGYEHYELSEQIGEDRLFPAVRQAGDAEVIACGISCRHQMHDFLDVKAKHWVEVVKAEPLEAEPVETELASAQ